MSASAAQGEGVPGRVVVANVNGLRRASKRHHLYHALGEGRWDVALLVETHCDGDEEAAAWLHEGAGPGLTWPGLAFWCHGSRRARGVAVLVRTGFAAADLRVDYADLEGCSECRGLRAPPPHGGRPSPCTHLSSPNLAPRSLPPGARSVSR